MNPISKLLLILCCVFTVAAGCTKKEDKRSGYIRRAFNANVKGLDPALISDVYSARVVAHMLEPLFQYNYLERPYKAEPLVAAGMPEVSKDGLTYTIKIKPGIKFHDDPAFKDGKGRDLTVEDFIYAWKRIADPNIHSENFWLFEGKLKGFTKWRDDAQKTGTTDYSKPIEGLQAVDATTLKIMLEKPFPQLVLILAMPTTAPIAKEVAEKYGKDLMNHPIGTGPYMLEDWTRNSEIVVKKNPSYRQEVYPSKGEASDEAAGFLADAGKPLPLNDGVVFKEYVEDQPRWLNFMKGNLDWVSIPKDNYNVAVVNGELSPDLKKLGISLFGEMSLDVTFNSFNMDDPVVGKNKLLRQALSLTVDDNDFIQKFYNGRAVQANGPIPPGLSGYDPNFKNPYKGPNIEKAKELLKKAGYPEGKGLPELVFSSSNGSTSRQIAEWYAARFALIGVKLKIEMTTWPEFTDKIKKRKAQIFGMAWNGDYPDAENFLALFYSKNASPGSNNSNYKNPEFDKLYEKASVLPEGAERTELYKKMVAIVAEDTPWIFNTHRKVEATYHGWVRNFKPSELIDNYTKYIRIDKDKKAELSKKL